MRALLRKILLYTISLYITSLVLPGVFVEGTLEGFLVGGIFLTFGHYIIRPILSVLTLPLKLLTFGLFSFLINGITLFIVTLLYDKLTISSFIFSKFVFLGIQTPSFYVPLPLSYVLISATIYTTLNILGWIFDE